MKVVLKNQYVNLGRICCKWPNDLSFHGGPQEDGVGGGLGTNLCLLNWILNGGLILIEMGLLEKHLNGGTSLLPLKKSEKIENDVTKINE